MLKKLLLSLILLSQFTLSAFATSKTIFMILPIEHEALAEIVSGFQSHFKNDDVKIIVKNALGDTNLQRTIIQQAIAQQPDLIVPVGTSTSLMTATMVQNVPVLALASQPIKAPNVTGVNDEVSVAYAYALMKNLKPAIKKLAVIYTPQDKNYDELKTLKQLIAPDRVSLQEILVPNLTDLYMNAQSISAQSDFIFIFKDNVIASGIPVLINQANLKHIPLMTSDEATVAKGACFALGVREHQIGVQGAVLAYEVLVGKQMPFERIKKLTLFINEKACVAQRLEPSLLNKAAKQLGYAAVELP